MHGSQTPVNRKSSKLISPRFRNISGSRYIPPRKTRLPQSSDITESKQAVAALLQANRQLNLMTNITRHDILNNVSAVLGYIDILRIKFPNPALTYYLSKLEDLTTAIQHLITDTQNYQNLGISEPKWQDIDKLVSHLHVPDSVTLTVDLRGVELYADPMLEKVFFNFLDNSIRHGQKVTEIGVSSRQSDEGLSVVWEDNGIGIPDEEKDKIFEKGYGKNTGLGLFLCREILTISGMTMRETGEAGQRCPLRDYGPHGGIPVLENAAINDGFRSEEQNGKGTQFSGFATIFVVDLFVTILIWGSFPVSFSMKSMISAKNFASRTIRYLHIYLLYYLLDFTEIN